MDNGEIDPAKSADVLELGPPRPTRHRRRGLLVGLIVAIVAAAVAVPSVVVLTGDSPPPAAAAIPSPSGLASGSPEGPQAQADLKIGESLKAMTKAMEAGDEAGFVAPAADKYVFDRKPDRYLVYVAGPAEWKKWFGGGQEDWVIGYAIETTENRSDIVLRADEIDGGDAEALMKHEMGHVATRGVPHPSGNAVWWLIEGIAEYVEWDGRGLGGYDGRQDVRRFLREKRFAGDPALVAPTDDPDDWEVNADYGIGFYYTRCIADRFGQDRLLAFTEAVLHDGDVVAPAATNTLGGSWPDITKRCLTYTKRAVGL